MGAVGTIDKKPLILIDRIEDFPWLVKMDADGTEM